MTTITLTGTYASGHEVPANATYVTITDTGYIGGAGLWVPGVNRYSISNAGRIDAGFKGSTGLSLTGGGYVSNGVIANTSALIEGYANGLILGSFHSGGAGTVVNYGTIANETPTAGGGGEGLGYGALLYGGGAITNGGVNETAALIKGGEAVEITGGSGAVTNFGEIDSTANGNAGVVMEGGFAGQVVNGDTTALIVGGKGILMDDFGAVTNLGTVDGDDGQGIWFIAGGSVTNGSESARNALIYGSQGAVYFYSGGSVTNFATIKGGIVSEGGPAGNASGSVTNGSATDTTALIEGYTGVTLSVLVASATGTVTNFGTITGQGSGGAQAGVVVTGGGGKVVNGSGTISGISSPAAMSPSRAACRPPTFDDFRDGRLHRRDRRADRRPLCRWPT
jgi:hypothetical protein